MLNVPLKFEVNCLLTRIEVLTQQRRHVKRSLHGNWKNELKINVKKRNRKSEIQTLCTFCKKLPTQPAI